MVSSTDRKRSTAGGAAKTAASAAPMRAAPTTLTIHALVAATAGRSAVTGPTTVRITATNSTGAAANRVRKSSAGGSVKTAAIAASAGTTTAAAAPAVSRIPALPSPHDLVYAFETLSKSGVVIDVESFMATMREACFKSAVTRNA